MSEYTTTPKLGLVKPNHNQDDGLWGLHLNQNADKLDNAILSLGGGGITAPLIYTATGGNTPRLVPEDYGPVETTRTTGLPSTLETGT